MEPKTELAAIKLSPADKVKIETLAEELGLTVSSFFRMLALEKLRNFEKEKRAEAETQ